MNMDNGLTTIQAARALFELFYRPNTFIYTKLQLKCWINHSESRHNNGNPPFTFGNYCVHMRDIDILEQVKLDMINCDDIGGKEAAIVYLEGKMYDDNN